MPLCRPVGRLLRCSSRWRCCSRRFVAVRLTLLAVCCGRGGHEWWYSDEEGLIHLFGRVCRAAISLGNESGFSRRRQPSATASHRHRTQQQQRLWPREFPQRGAQQQSGCTWSRLSVSGKRWGTKGQADGRSSSSFHRDRRQPEESAAENRPELTTGENPLIVTAQPCGEIHALPKTGKVARKLESTQPRSPNPGRTSTRNLAGATRSGRNSRATT